MINLIAGLICSIFAVLPIYKLFQLNGNVKKCWPSIKCSPVGQLLFPLFGPKGISAQDNQNICDSGKFSSMFNSKISNVNNSVSLLNKVVADIHSDVDKVKIKLYNVQVKAIEELKKVALAFNNTYKKIGDLSIVLFQTISNILQIFKHTLKLGQASYYSTKSMWDGPIGGIGRTFGGLF
jgi:hypothetical protein